MKQKQPEPFLSILKYSRLIILILPLLVYISAVNLGFVYFDDVVLILGNFDKLKDISNIGLAFRTDAFFSNVSPYYRPLMNVSFMVDALMGSSSPGIFHFWNLVYHLLTCLSIFWLLPQLGFTKSQSMVATLVFSVHPTLAHAVLWIPARGDLLVTLFAILSFGLLLKNLKQFNYPELLLHLLCFGLALFSKESGILLPVLFFFFMLIKRETIFKKENFILYIGWILIITVWFLLRDMTIDHRQDSQRGLNALIQNLPFLPEAVTRLVFPIFLPVVPVFSHIVTILGIISSIVILFLIIKSNMRSNLPLIIFGTVWFIGFCIPNMYVRLNSANDSFEYLLHRLYLPSVGFIIIILSLVPETAFDLLKKNTVLVVGGVLLFFGIYNQFQQLKYKTSDNYWESAIRYAPERSWYYYLHGRYYFKIRDLEKYENLLVKAVNIKPYSMFLYQLGMIYYTDRKDYNKAYQYFTTAFAHGHKDPEAYDNFAKLCIESSYSYFKRNEIDSAIQRCSEVFAYDPSNGVAAYNLGIYLITKGEKQKAAGMWYQAVKNQPELKDAYKSLSLYYQYDRIIHDSAEYFAEQYLKHGGITSPLIDNGK